MAFSYASSQIAPGTSGKDIYSNMKTIVLPSELHTFSANGFGWAANSTDVVIVYVASITFNGHTTSDANPILVLVYSRPGWRW